MSQLPGALPLVQPDQLTSPAPPVALSPEIPEVSRPPLSYKDANSYLDEFGLEAYAEMIEGLRLAGPEQYALVKAIEATFSKAQEATDPQLVASLMDAAHGKKAELLQGSFARVCDLSTQLYQAGSLISTELLLIEANKLASRWFDANYSASRIRRAPVYPDDILCLDYLRPRLINYKPKQSDPRRTKDIPAKAEVMVTIREIEDGQLYLPALLGKYRKPPTQKLGTIIVEATELEETRGQLSMNDLYARQELAHDEPARVVGDSDSEISKGPDIFATATPQEISDANRELPHDPEEVDVLPEEIDPDALIELLGDLDEFGEGDSPEELLVEDEDIDEGDESPKKAGTKARGNGDSLTIEDVSEQYGYDHILRAGSDLEKMVARFVMDNDPSIEEVDITNEFLFPDIVKALRKCLYMTEYRKSDDLEVRNRFARVSYRAQDAGKDASNNEKKAKAAAKKADTAAAKRAAKKSQATGTGSSEEIAS